MTRAEIIAEARGWVNVPFHRKGRSRAGLDCIGLVVMLMRAFEVPHQDRQDYSDLPDGQGELLRACSTYLVRMPVNSPLPGLIGLFAEARMPGHVGVFSTLNGLVHVIHARVLERRVIEQLYRPQDRDVRLIALFALPGTDD